MSIDRRLFLGGAAAAALLSNSAPAAPETSADAIIDRFAREHAFSGSVAVARRGRIIHQRLFGLADRERKVPIAPGTTFRIGSVSKWFTTVAALRLVERGVLSLAAPIGTYITTLGEAYAAVPLEHLLANNSGIPDRISEAIKKEPSLRESRAGSAEMLARFGDGPLDFVPGEKFDYSFFNWVLIHAALERATGLAFEQVIAREVFQPLRLFRSGFVDTRSADVGGLAVAYSSNGERKDARVPPFGGASGNIYGDAADLVRAAHGVFEVSSILTPALRAQLLRVRIPQENYALGGRVRTIGDRQVAWETGKVQAYRTHLAHVIGADHTIVLLNNNDLDQGVISAFVEQLLRLT